MTPPRALALPTFTAEDAALVTEHTGARLEPLRAECPCVVLAVGPRSPGHESVRTGRGRPLLLSTLLSHRYNDVRQT